MAKKRKHVRKCRWHILGQYYHSVSELVHFACPEDIDGMGHTFPLQYYGFCPICGTEITEEIKDKQMGGDK